MRLKKSFICLVLASVIFTQPVFAAKLTADEASSQLNTLMEYILENYVGEVTVDELYAAAARGMTTPLDEYTEYLSASEYDSMYNSLAGNFKGIGIQFSTTIDGSLEIIKVMDNSPAKAAGLLKGDIIKTVNTQAVNGYTTEALSQIIAGIDDEIVLEVLRGTETKRFSMIKAEVHMPTVEYGMISEYIPDAEDIMGYISISQIGERTATEMKEAIDALRGKEVTRVVLDFRGNPGGFKNVIDEIARMFVPKGAIYSTVDAKGNTVVNNSTLESPPFNWVAILVDSGTASACELFTSAMQDARAAVVIGQRTYGKGVIQRFAEFPSGDTLKYTSMEYLRRSGNKLHGLGVTPDIEITKPAFLTDSAYIMYNDGTGAGVQDCKSILSYMGYEIDSDDSFYDESTKAAVLDIQKQAKLNETGALDSETIKAINTAYTIYKRNNDAELLKAYELGSQ